MQLKDQRIFVTGASSGIGAALAEKCIKEGAKVALMARRQDWLQKIAKDFPENQYILYSGDVTNKQNLTDITENMVKIWGGVDIVFANAGFGVGGSFEKLTVEDYRRQFETNFFGVLNTIYATLPYLKESKGKLTVTSSIAGRIGVPVLSAYNSSKFAICGLCESIYYEFKAFGVSVTCIQPGIIASNFSKVNNNNQYCENQEDTRPQKIMMPVEIAVKQILYATQKRKKEYTITNHARFMLFLKRFFPLFLDYVLQKIYKVRKNNEKQ